MTAPDIAARTPWDPDDLQNRAVNGCRFCARLQAEHGPDGLWFHEDGGGYHHWTEPDAELRQQRLASAQAALTNGLTVEVWELAIAAKESVRYVDHPDNDVAHYGISRYALRTIVRAVYQAGIAAGQDQSAALAQGLLDIAELAMPDTYFATDSRCELAREVLARHQQTEESTADHG